MRLLTRILTVPARLKLRLLSDEVEDLFAQMTCAERGSEARMLLSRGLAEAKAELTAGECSLLDKHRLVRLDELSMGDLEMCIVGIIVVFAAWASVWGAWALCVRLVGGA